MVRSRGTQKDYIEQAKEKKRDVMLPGLTKAAKFRLYNERGDAYYAAGKNRGAYENYRKASRYVIKADKERLYRRMERVKPSKKRGKGLEKYFPLAILAIGSFAIALFFISFNLTGYVAGGLTQENSRWISTSLFILGLVFAFFYFKNKK